MSDEREGAKGPEGESIGPESIFRGDFMALFTLPVLLTTLAGVIVGVFVAADPLEGRSHRQFYEKYAPMPYDAFSGFSSYADEDRSPPPMVMFETPKMPGGMRSAVDRFLASEDSAERREGVRMLGLLPFEDPVDRLMEILDDPDDEVRKEAETALRRLTGENLFGREAWLAWWRKKTGEDRSAPGENVPEGEASP